MKGDAVTSADLALTGGNVLTLRPSQPSAEAVAVKGDRIVKVGTNEEISQLVGKDTKVIHLNGKTVVPGFIDTHIHVADFGRLLTWIDLSDVGSIKEMQKSLSIHVAKLPNGKWLLGRGWDQTRLAEKRLPTRFDLDSVSPDNPVIFYHQSGQVCVVNSKALELAGVTRLTPVPPGGAIDRDAETDEPTGVLRDNATNLIWAAIPQPSEEELVEAAGLACEKILEAGVTSVHWMVSSPIELSIIRTLLAQNRLPMRVYVIIPVNLGQHRGLQINRWLSLKGWRRSDLCRRLFSGENSSTTSTIQRRPYGKRKNALHSRGNERFSNQNTQSGSSTGHTRRG